MKDWISVKDCKPAPKVMVLAVVGVGKRRHVEVACYGYARNSPDWWSETYKNAIPAWSVTYWQPIPEVPPET